MTNNTHAKPPCDNAAHKVKVGNGFNGASEGPSYCAIDAPAATVNNKYQSASCKIELVRCTAAYPHRRDAITFESAISKAHACTHSGTNDKNAKLLAFLPSRWQVLSNTAINPHVVHSALGLV